MDKKVTFETAVLAKRAGFNIDPDNWFYNTYKGENNLFNWRNDCIESALDRADCSPGNDYGYIQSIREVVNDTDTFENDDTTNISAPSQTALQKWLREKYKMHVYLNMTGTERFTLHFRFVDKSGKHWLHWEQRTDTHVFYKCMPGKSIQISSFDNYEEALEIGLERALQTIIVEYDL